MTLQSVCMVCLRPMTPGSHSYGQPIEKGPGQSHGLCLECLPGWGKEAGLSEAQIAEIRGNVERMAA